MLDLNKHKFLMVQILKDIYSDIELATILGFKGGSALLFFYDLPRFSIDLDFNLLDIHKSNIVFKKLKKILLKYGKIKDEAKKHFGLLLVLDYGEKERNLKLEISNRQFDDTYETGDFLGISVKVMKESDLFAHKISALLDRKMIASRDVFDCWFFMQKRTPVNKNIVEARHKINFSKYLDKCIKTVSSMKDSEMLNGVGEFVDEDLKKFVRNKIKSETIQLFRMYKKFPIFE